MVFDDHFNEILIKLIVSLVIGTIIGAEREYRNKSAGLRTMILICLGSTIFTIVSIEVSHPTEIGRIASNIVTGIGFLGAGAIMREGLTISGLTTASAIWVVSSLGMAIGAGQFQLAITATILAMIVLVIFHHLQIVFDRQYKNVDLHVVFDADVDRMKELEQKMNEIKISFHRKKESRKERNVKYEYGLKGKARSVKEVIAYLIAEKEKVKSFDYWD
jgi:putative Mg2+ transporter-C (MgtC) family protein